MGALRGMLGSKYRCIDAHLHVVDFLQDTKGLQHCLHYMDKGNISHASIFGLPVSKGWESWERHPPEYYLADDSKCYYYSAVDAFLAMELRSLDPAQQARFFPMIGGFNPCDKYAYKHIERIIRYFPGIWHGVGEILFRHDDLTNLTYGDPSRCNHPAMDSIFDICIEHEFPICIHQNITSVGTKTYPKWLHEVEETFHRHPKVQFVWAHCGISRGVYTPLYYQIVKRIMEHYGNVCVDLSWIVYDEFICPKGVLDDHWLKLADEYSDRICIGTDVVNRFEYLPATIQKYDMFLDALSESARENVAWKTAFRLYSPVRA